MHLRSRMSSPGSRARFDARLHLEVLESRLAPAVVGVDAGANVHANQPNIYGSAFASTAQLADLHLTINRSGGNAADTYSLAQDATNHANDYFFESIPLGSGKRPGDGLLYPRHPGRRRPGRASPSTCSTGRQARGQPLHPRQFPVAKYGQQSPVDPDHPEWGNGIAPDGFLHHRQRPQRRLRRQHPNDQKAWIQHLISTFGDSQHGGVQYYTMGNEPGAWSGPAGPTATSTPMAIP